MTRQSCGQRAEAPLHHERMEARFRRWAQRSRQHALRVTAGLQPQT
jgi:hypothetical protein